MASFLEGFTPYRKEDADRYDRLRWWPGLALGDLLDKAADVCPDKEAFVDGQSRLTFALVREKTNRLALALLNLGIAPGERVLVQLPNWNEFVLAYFAVQKIGAVAVLSIDRHRQYELGHLAELAGATAWIVPERYKKTDYLPIVQDVVRERQSLKQVILARSAGQGTFLSLEKLIAETPLDDAGLRRLADCRPDPLAVAHMGATGGTTGLPKLVPRTHNSLICGVEYVSYAFDMEARDVLLLAGPIGHDLTFTKGLLCSLFTRGKTVFLDSMEMEGVCAAIARERVTTIAWVPTLAQRLIDFEGLKDHDLRSLRAMYCGGGASHPEVVKAVRDKLHCIFHNSYGSTEGQSTMSRAKDTLETILHTVGKPTCPYDTYRVIGPEGKDLPLRVSGELIVKGPGHFSGYYQAPEENARVFTADGFFKTGDLAFLDERGYVTITGRLKEMINRGGESISAREIETLIVGHPEVVDCAVIPMPDLELGERVCAYVQCSPGVRLSFAAIIAYLKEQKASVLHLPERIEFIAALPVTKAEKVDKLALMEDIKKKLGLLPS
ncbi:MAG: AMP-binding protein [Deltaproteobacteria bacterium]|nr:AMP-binding protein [Deltaproteobacteria bacterium]